MATLPFEAMSSAMGVVGSPFGKIAKHFLLSLACPEHGRRASSLCLRASSLVLQAGGEVLISRGSRYCLVAGLIVDLLLIDTLVRIPLIERLTRFLLLDFLARLINGKPHAIPGRTDFTAGQISSL